ncbi:FG-GAP repeat domain-containing protein [Aequorivita nionensis]|uniref:FG-GAP repeat domain-containing protein n=1 Tax=Aequorivita nionensis TaxID=1287690 RepID=UPI003965CD37
MKTALLFLSAILFSFSISAQIDFEPHITVDDTGGTNGANSVFAADLDGDGDMDMISASTNDDKIAWYKNIDGLGAFGPQQIISETALGAYSVFATDIDGDGDMDILAASYFDDTIGWFANNGQGTFGSRQIISTLADGASSVYANDADGDGDMDVFSASATDDKIAWYENTNGQGNFGAQQVISTNFDYPLEVVAGDIDGDGDMDILSGSRYNNSRVAWFKNTNGQGNFVFQQELTTDISYCRAATLADMDGDGDLDIVATSWTFGSHRVIWFENTNGQGNFNNTPNTVGLLTNNANPETLYAKDFDNDGDLDIAVGTYN